MGHGDDDSDYPKAFERGTAIRKMQERDMRSQLEADEHRSDPQVDTDSNDLHAGAGQLCPLCGRPIRPGQAARRTVSGRYQHDSC